MIIFSLPPTPTLADYVVLENLTSKFSAPSVLDLKVGNTVTLRQRRRYVSTRKHAPT